MFRQACQRHLSRQTARTRLGLEKTALIDEATLKTAYLAQAKLYHPDTMGGDEKKFNEIKEAFELLSSPVEQAATSNDEEHRMEKEYKQFVKEDELIKQRYAEFKAKHGDDVKLTEDEYIAMVRGRQATIKNSLLRISLAFLLILFIVKMKD